MIPPQPLVTERHPSKRLSFRWRDRVTDDTVHARHAADMVSNAAGTLHSTLCMVSSRTSLLRLRVSKHEARTSRHLADSRQRLPWMTWQHTNQSWRCQCIVTVHAAATTVSGDQDLRWLRGLQHRNWAADSQLGRRDRTQQTRRNHSIECLADAVDGKIIAEEALIFLQNYTERCW